MKIAVIPNLTRERAASVTEDVCMRLRELGAEYCFRQTLKNKLQHIVGAEFKDTESLYADCDLVIAVGGDGSVMRAAKEAAVYGKRILGIKAGRLAYLCGLDADETELLSKLVSGEYSVARRMMLHAELIRNGSAIISENCLNDIVFGRGTDIALSEIKVDINGKPTADYIADGLIVATPTGSTAYSMSAGGPILEPTLEAVLMTPICPHSLVSRPYILSADTVLEIECEPMRTGTSTGVSFDGSDTVKLLAGDKVKIEKSHEYVDIISIKSDNFIDILNGKDELKR